MQDKLKELEKKHSVDWREFKIGELFEIRNTLSFNKDKLVLGNEYDYVTRTSQNQGILQETGFVNQEHLNPPGIWSLGLLQMDFFYRKKPWYAGQFVRKIIPKRDLSKNAVLYFTVLLNKQKKTLLSGLVRDVDKNFLTSTIKLPTLNNEIAFDYIEEFISTLEAERLATLEAYLLATGLKDIELSNEEREALDKLQEGSGSWSEFRIGNLFNISTGRDFIIGKTTNGNVPLVSHQHENNGITKHVTAVSNRRVFNHDTTISLADRGVFYATTQNVDFHIGTRVKALNFKDGSHDLTERLFVVSSINKLQVLFTEYAANATNKLPDFSISLPLQVDGEPDFKFMKTVIKAIQKVVIKNVVIYLDKQIDTTSQIIKDL